MMEISPGLVYFLWFSFGSRVAGTTAASVTSLMTLPERISTTASTATCAAWGRA